MNLPPSLAPWAGYLNIFPEEVSQALGPVIQRVSILSVRRSRDSMRRKASPMDLTGSTGAELTSDFYFPSGCSRTNSKMSLCDAP